MKNGYIAELGMHKQQLGDARAGLEEWYARRMKDEDIMGEERARYDEVLQAVDQAVVSFQGAAKMIRSAMVPEPLILPRSSCVQKPTPKVNPKPPNPT